MIKQVISLTEKSLQNTRLLVQTFFILLCIWIGIEFHLFVNYLASNGQTWHVSRPAGVEGFLPISSLMNLFLFVQTGIIHSAHPAGFFIFLSIIIMSVIFGKSFCSWFCPVGTLSEYLANFGQKLFRRKIKMHKIPDTLLRAVKYLLLLFFAWAIFGMSTTDLNAFLNGDYNIVADIKMYLFFANITFTSFIVILVLMLLSVVFRGFWCRYLCPYGALLGVFGLVSIFKIKRKPETCINCARCAKVCPAFIKVDKVKTVISDECSSCMKCVDNCPVAKTLEIKPVFGKNPVKKILVPLTVLLVFLFCYSIGKITGMWDNGISDEVYFRLYKIIDQLDHLRGGV